MCGIIWAKSKKGKNINNYVLEHYKQQRTRGSDGFGFIAIKDGKISIHRAENEIDIKKELQNVVADEILFHHRYPTSTPNFVQATHPIKVEHDDFVHNYYVVHNGIISNDYSLKREHENLGFVYSTRLVKKWITGGTIIQKEEMFNDSEALAVEVALYLEGKKDTIDAKGSIALMVLQVDKKTNKVEALYYGRNGGNPLKIHRSNKKVVIASENKGVLLPENTLYRLDYKTGEISQFFVNVGEYKNTYYGLSDYTGTRAGYNYQEEDDYEIDEEDFADEYILGAVDRLKELEEEIANAKRSNNYDLEVELEVEKIDLEEYLLSAGVSIKSSIEEEEEEEWF